MAWPHTSPPRKKVLRRFLSRTFQQERLGFEAYVWAVHRITGLILMAFLIFHLFTLSSIFAGSLSYDKILSSLDTPIVKAGEILLLWVIFFHVLNGLRLIVFNFFPAINHKRMAYAFSAVSLILALLSIPVVLGL